MNNREASDLRYDEVVYVLETPGAPLRRANVVMVRNNGWLIDLAFPGTLDETVKCHVIYTRAFGLGTCQLCGAPPDQPYRRHDSGGAIIEGCVAFEHDGRLQGQDLHWHTRPVSFEIRQARDERRTDIPF